MHLHPHLVPNDKNIVCERPASGWEVSLGEEKEGETQEGQPARYSPSW